MIVELDFLYADQRAEAAHFIAQLVTQGVTFRASASNGIFRITFIGGY